MKRHLYTIIIFILIIFIPNLLGQFLHYIGIDYYGILADDLNPFALNWGFGFMTIIIMAILSLIYLSIYSIFDRK